VATGDGMLSLDYVQPAGKRAMPIAEFLRGHAVHVGDRFGSARG
jgi:methionyl-tRNA formyltransferase